VISDGCLAHKTAVALAALSQYLRFIVFSTSAADKHLLSINYLVEPYRLPQKTTTTTASVERVADHAGNISHRGEMSPLAKDSKNPAVVGDHPGATVDTAGVKKSASDRKIDREDGKHVDVGDYDEHAEVELDKDDVKRVPPRDFRGEVEVRPSDEVTAGSNVVADPAFQAFADENEKRSHGDLSTVQFLFKSHWFLLVVAVFLLVVWFRCMRCFRCGFLLRRCRWI